MSDGAAAWETLSAINAELARRAAQEATIQAEEQRYRRDPLFWVEQSFPWGAPGALQNETGPDDWQRDLLIAVRDGLSTIQAIQMAIASGHGIGKSACVSWLILWGLTTLEDTRGVVTANTDVQLKTKTWAELGKWFGMMRGRDRFRLTATAIMSLARPLTWRIDAIAWSAERPEAFAGLHNAGKRVVVIFDEASTIVDIIWETMQGALTDMETELLWFVFGNPTRNTGRFRECFGRFRHRWQNRQIDSRTAKKTNKAEIAKIVADYGEDHDITRVRVRGEFPRAGSMQFIPSDIVEVAMKRAQIYVDDYDPLVLGCDIARSLDGDETVLFPRRGRDARSIPRVRMRVRDTMLIAAKIVELNNLVGGFDAIFVDGGGVGGGVVDRLAQLRLPVIEVQFGGDPTGGFVSKNDGTVYYNRRAEMWGNMRDWIETGVLPDDVDLTSELISVEYGYKLKDGKDAILLEKKEDMKKRGLASPDNGDGLALTFAAPVQRLQKERRPGIAGRVSVDYDPLESFRREITPKQQRFPGDMS